jgi:preprotein translocase subunit SecF
MQFLNKQTHIDFLSQRKITLVLSVALIVISIVALATRSLNFGIDFTGGTLVEVGYSQSVEVDAVRVALSDAGIEDAIVQHFGTAKDVMIRLPVAQRENAAGVSGEIMATLRSVNGESLAGSIEGQNSVQQCVKAGQTGACEVQMRRVEFVGPQVGDELANQGGLAMIYALIGAELIKGILGFQLSQYLTFLFLVSSGVNLMANRKVLFYLTLGAGMLVLIPETIEMLWDVNGSLRISSNLAFSIFFIFMAYELFTQIISKKTVDFSGILPFKSLCRRFTYSVYLSLPIV